jgi:hypothetical protein
LNPLLFPLNPANVIAEKGSSNHNAYHEEFH